MMRKFDTFLTDDTNPAVSNGNGKPHFTPAVCFINIEEIAYAVETKVEGFENCYFVRLKSGEGFTIVNVKSEMFVDPFDIFMSVISAGYDVCNAYYEYDESIGSDLSQVIEAINELQDKLDRTEKLGLIE